MLHKNLLSVAHLFVILCTTEGHQGSIKSAFVGFSTLAPFSPCLPSGPAGPRGPCLKQEKMAQINLGEYFEFRILAFGN